MKVQTEVVKTFFLEITAEEAVEVRKICDLARAQQKLLPAGTHSFEFEEVLQTLEGLA